VLPRPTILNEAFAKARSRSSWNDRLTHWEKPASTTEEAQIERAAAMVRGALSSSQWLIDAGASVLPQGSYHNNTNVRQTADQDLRSVHPFLKIECADVLNLAGQRQRLGITDVGQTFAGVIARMRLEIDVALAMKFGWLNLDTSGTKATRVLALPGSRAPVDVVAAFRYVWVMGNGLGGLKEEEGIAILGKDNKWTHNFPIQHHDNGIAKRANTLHRFKKVVRSLKRLRDELVTARVLGPKQCPSFLIECLTYAVEDFYFLATGPDERYDRIVQIVERMDALLDDDQWILSATEINGIKYLFRDGQAWTLADARTFVRAAYTRLLEA
jgi:hypothetical protein